MIVKICSNCKQEKLTTEFYLRRKKDAIYLSSHCKNCQRLRNRTLERRKYNNKWCVEHSYDKIGFARLQRDIRYLVMKAVKKGKLIKTPCIICKERKVEGHHFNYKEPLKVVWLCNSHHRDVHSIYKFAKIHPQPKGALLIFRP